MPNNNAHTRINEREQQAEARRKAEEYRKGITAQQPAAPSPSSQRKPSAADNMTASDWAAVGDRIRDNHADTKAVVDKGISTLGKAGNWLIDQFSKVTEQNMRQNQMALEAQGVETGWDLGKAGELAEEISKDTKALGSVAGNSVASGVIGELGHRIGGAVDLVEAMSHDSVADRLSGKPSKRDKIEEDLGFLRDASDFFANWSNEYAQKAAEAEVPEGLEVVSNYVQDVLQNTAANYSRGLDPVTQIVGVAAGGNAAKAYSYLTMFLSSMNSGKERAMSRGLEGDKADFVGIANGLNEVLQEVAFDAVGITSDAAMRKFGDTATGGLRTLNDFYEQAIAKYVSNDGLKLMLHYLGGIGDEVAQEVLGTFVDMQIDKYAFGDEASAAKFASEAGDTALKTILSTLLLTSLQGEYSAAGQTRILQEYADMVDNSDLTPDQLAVIQSRAAEVVARATGQDPAQILEELNQQVDLARNIPAEDVDRMEQVEQNTPQEQAILDANEEQKQAQERAAAAVAEAAVQNPANGVVDFQVTTPVEDTAEAQAVKAQKAEMRDTLLDAAAQDAAARAEAAQGEYLSSPAVGIDQQQGNENGVAYGATYERSSTPGAGNVVYRYKAKDGSTIEVREYTGKLKNHQTRAVNAGNRLGRSVVMVESLPYGNNAFYDPASKTIYISAKAGNAATSLFFHELTHNIASETGRAERWKEFLDYAFDASQAAHGNGWAKYYDDLRADYAKFYDENDADFDDMIREEVAAEFAEDYLFRRKNAVKELQRRNGNIFSRIWQKLIDFNRASGNDREALLVKAEQLFSDVYNEATENLKAGEPMGPRQEAYWSRAHDAQMSETADKKNRSKGFRRIAENVLQTAAMQMERVKELMDREDINAALPIDTTEGNNGNNTEFSNGSYGVSEENTTVCVRQICNDIVCDAVAEAVGRPLNVLESLWVSQQFMGYADKGACLYCYELMDRWAKSEFVNRYFAERDAVIADLRSGMDPDAAFEKFLNKRKATTAKYNKKTGEVQHLGMTERFDMFKKIASGEIERAVTPADIASQRTIDQTLEAHPELADQIKDIMYYAQSASWAKKKVAYTAYNGHILKWTAAKIKKLNSTFGLRFYSFSDFSPAFILENMQMVRDAAVQGLKGLAYTKETDFVKIFAPTGMNINMSIFGYTNERGEVVEDAMQGAKWEDVKAMRDKYPNVGAVFVATSERQVQWALSQDWIDVVIPFHTVRTGKTVAEALGYTIFTGMQEDGKAEGWTKDKDLKAIDPALHNNDKELYLKLLEQNHLTPRFADWADNPGYMKLVNETRRPYGETEAMQPIFDISEVEDMLNKFVAKGGYENEAYGSTRFPLSKAAQKIADDFKRNINDIEAQVRRTPQFKDIVKDYDTNVNTLHDDANPRFARGVTPQMASDYQTAYEEGDEATAQRLVDEAAEANGYVPFDLYHGTGEYFTKFLRGAEGIHLGNLAQATQVAKSRFLLRSKKTTYDWNDVRNRLGELDQSTRESLTNQAWLKQDYFSDGQSVDQFVNVYGRDALLDDALVRDYVDSIIDRYNAYTGENWAPYTRSVTIPTFDRKVGKNVMRLYGRVASPFVINGDVLEWSPYKVADVLLDRNNGLAEYEVYGKTRDISGSQLELDNEQVTALEDIVAHFSQKKTDEYWRTISEILDEQGYDCIKYRNEYEGNKQDYSYLMFNPSDVKSADPFTFDDDGNLIPLAERFEPANNDIRWARGLDKVEYGVKYSELVSEGDKELYDKAKEGDVKAAADLIEKFVTDANVAAIAKFGEEAYLLPVVGQTGTSRNAIPINLARYFSRQTGQRVFEGVYQTDTLNRRSLQEEERLAMPDVRFDMDDESGYNQIANQRFVLIDDNTSYGSTFRGLRNFIEEHGGEVVGAYALTVGGDNSAYIDVTDSTWEKLEKEGLDNAERIARENGFTGEFGRRGLGERRAQNLLKLLKAADERRGERTSRVGEGEGRRVHGVSGEGTTGNAETQNAVNKDDASIPDAFSNGDERFARDRRLSDDFVDSEGYPLTIKGLVERYQIATGQQYVMPKTTRDLDNEILWRFQQADENNTDIDEEEQKQLFDIWGDVAQMQDNDRKYEEAYESNNVEEAARLVKEAAAAAGYTKKLYSGTRDFGYTSIDPEMADDRMTYWATPDEKVAATYTIWGKRRISGSEISDEQREDFLAETKTEIEDEVYDFCWLISKYFSEWAIGPGGEVDVLDTVMAANPKAGYGDGVYDYLEEIIANAYHNYGDEAQEQYGGFDVWQDTSDAANELYSKINGLEALRRRYDDIENGDIDTAGVYELYANTDDMLEFDGKGANWNELTPTEEMRDTAPYRAIGQKYWRTRNVAEWAAIHGYYGVHFKDIVDNGGYGNAPVGDVYAFFDAQAQLKSADPFTFDDNGRLIPLSERFNDNSIDLRFARQRKGNDEGALGATVSEEEQRRQRKLMKDTFKEMADSFDGKRGEFKQPSRVGYNTLSRTPLFDTAEKNMLQVLDGDKLRDYYGYAPESEVESLHNARERVEKDQAAEERGLPHKFWDGEDTDTAMLILSKKLAEAQQTGDYSQVRKWAKMIQRRGTEAGKRIQAFAKYTATPEGMLVKCGRVLEESTRLWQEKHPKQTELVKRLATELMNGFEDADWKFNETVNVKDSEAYRRIYDVVKRLAKQADVRISNPAQAAEQIAELVMAEKGEERRDIILTALDNLVANDYIGLTDEEMAEVYDLFEEAGNYAPTSKEAFELESRAYKIFADHINSTWEEKWNAWRYLAMLGNTRTHIKNIVGNIMFGQIVAMKDGLAGVLEQALGVENRTKTANLAWRSTKKGKALYDAAKADANHIYTILRGKSKYNVEQSIEGQKRIFKTNWLEKLRKANDFALEAEDWWALQKTYARVLGNYMYTNGLTKADLDADTTRANIARAYAVEEAQKATFRNYNAFARALSTFSDNLNNSDSKAAKALGVVVEGVMPFKSTPANIVARGIEFSPANIISTISKEIDHVRTGYTSGADVVDSLSAGLTGTGVLALGALLASSGILTGGDDDDDRVQTWKESTGHQNYALQIGNKSYTLDWAAPAALPLFAGVEIGNAMQGKGFDVNSVLTAIASSANPAVEMTMMQGVKNIIDNAAYGDNSLASIAFDAATSYATQGIPTMSGQLARSIDDTRRTAAGDDTGFKGDLEYLWNKTLTKTPFASKTVEPYIDVWGREQKNAGGNLAGRLLYNTLSPGYASTIEKTAADNFVESVYDATGDSKALPQKPSRTVNKERLDADTYTAYAKKVGQTSYDLVTSLSRVKGLDSAAKLDVLEKVYKYAQQKAQVELGIASDSTKKSYEKYKAMTSKGINLVTYWTADKDGSGTVSQEELFNTGLSEAEKKAMWEAIGWKTSYDSYAKSHS